MSRCDLEIVLEEPGRTYHPGETLKGTVQASVNASCECRKLTITRRWRTHGRGNKAEGEKEEQVLFAGTWMPGGSHACPLSFVVPEGPVTYHGHYLNVDWYLEARADVPWAIDPKAETEFLLEPGADGRHIDLGPEYDPERPPTEFGPEQAMRIVGSIAAIVFVIGVAVAVLAGLGLAGIRPLGWAPGFGLGMFGLFAAFAGSVIAFKGLRNVMAERVLGKVRAECQPRQLRPGETVRCSIDFMPKKAVQLGEVKVKLIGQEVVVSGSGTNRTTHRHRFHEEEALLAPGRSLMRGMPLSLRGELRVPDEAPTTFMADDNRISWSVEIHVDIPGSPDYKSETFLTVRP